MDKPLEHSKAPSKTQSTQNPTSKRQLSGVLCTYGSFEGVMVAETEGYHTAERWWIPPSTIFEVNVSLKEMTFGSVSRLTEFCQILLER